MGKKGKGKVNKQKPKAQMKTPKQVKAVLPPGERIQKVDGTEITYGIGDEVYGNN
jgi:hypothetical protein